MKRYLILLFALAISLTSYGQNTEAQNLTIINIVRNNTLSPARVANALDALNYSKQGILQAFTASGTDTYAVTGPVAITSYASGQIVIVTFTNANTGASTLNINSTGAVALKDNEGNALTAGALVAGGTYIFKHNGTNFWMVGASGGGGGSGTVESVTGDGVDNTDPDNPVLDLIDDAIVNSELKAPSQNAVYDALALKQDASGAGTVTSIATTSPITGGTITGTGTIAINNAAADGSTKGAASFTANDFDASSGNVAIDYTNGQAAATGTKGFLTSTDWNTFNDKAPTASPTFTGTPTAPTAAPSTNSTQIATTAYVQAELSALNNLTVVSVTTDATLNSTAFGTLHICTGTSADYTVELPTAVGNAGKTLAIKGSSTLTKKVTIDGNTTQTIDGELTREFSSGGTFVLESDGTNWNILHEMGSWVPYTPTWGGYSAAPSSVDARYFRLGNRITVLITATAGTSNATSHTVTLPFNARTLQQSTQMMVNGGTGVSGRCDLAAGSNVATLYTTGAGVAWSNSGNKNAFINLTYEK